MEFLLCVTPKIWSWRWESNPQPADYKSAALPVELRQQQVWELISKDISWQEEFFLSPGVPRKQQKTCTQEAALCKAFSSLFSNFFYSRRFSVSFRAHARHALSPADCPVVSFSERSEPSGSAADAFFPFRALPVIFSVAQALFRPSSDNASFTPPRPNEKAALSGASVRAALSV